MNGVPPLSAKRFRFHATTWIMLAFALSVVLALGLLQLQRTYRHITGEQQSRLQTQARVVSENIVRQLRGVDNALRSLRTDVVTTDQTTTASTAVSPHRLKELGDAMPGVRSIVVIDAAGTVVLSERSSLTGQNFGSREYFTVPRDRTDFTSLYVSRPFTSTRGIYSINLGIAVPTATGEFDGIVSANLDPDYFEIMARSVLYAPDMLVHVIHGDGRLFVEVHPEKSDLSRDLQPMRETVVAHIRSQREETITRHIDPSTHGERMVVLRTVFPQELNMDTPLVVSVSRDMKEIYAPWHDDLWTYAIVFLLLCTVSSGTLYFVQQRKTAARRSEDERRVLVDRNAAQLEIAAELQRRTGQLAKVGGWQLELPSMRMTWTDEMFDIHGLDQRTPLSLSAMLAQYTPDARRRVDAAVHDAIQQGAPWSMDLQLTTGNGRSIWVRTQGEAVIEDARVVRLVAASQDITERVKFSGELQAANEKLARLTLTDGLTGVGNRRLFDQELAAEWSRCARRGISMGLLMVDIDHFKLYNDHYGHQGGDDALQRVAEILERCIERSGELVARYGGEEFVVLLPGSDMERASTVAEIIVSALANAGIPHETSTTSSVLTVSVGVASAHPSQSDSPKNLLRSADRALYIAKHLGRNRAEQAPMLQS